VKVEQTPNTPTLAVAKDQGVDLGLDVQAIAQGLGAEFGSAGGGGGDGTGRGALAFNAGLSDRDPLPLVRVEPEYPPQARQRKLEGWVQVRFTISTAGSVKDAAVVKSSHSLFERNALQAVSKWKYQPQLQDGKPTETPGQQVVLRFRMEG
jgi:protein TonB